MSSSFIRILLTSIVLTSVIPTSAQEQKLAVVIGVNAYRANSGLPTLQHAASDAAALSSTLRNTGFTVYEMTHDEARKAGQETMSPQLAYIRDQIKGVLEFPNLGDRDAVLITLHGHGVQYDMVDAKGNKTPKFYFCPADATVDGLKTANEITDRNRLLPLEELYADLASCPAATKLLIVDACRNDPTSPSVFRESLASATLPKLPAPTGGTAAFFSCKANQRAVEDSALKQGVFSHFLVKGLQGEADLPLAGKPADGIITFAELSAYVANNTYAHVYDKYKVRQSPELRGDYDLNLPLARISKPLPDLITNSVSMKLKLIRTGEFLMGNDDTRGGLESAGFVLSDSFDNSDEHPAHRVRITKPFYMGIHEVTRGQFAAFVNETSYQTEAEKDGKGGYGNDAAGNGAQKPEYNWKDNGTSQTDAHPVINVSWNDALEFVKWLSKQEGKQYRLPTEAEWEYCCRAASGTHFSSGDGLVSLKGFANVLDTSYKGEYTNNDDKVYQPFPFDDGFVYTSPVGRFKPNGFGLYDMHGNVWEWCSDRYGKDYYATSPMNDPAGATSGSYRVCRGGSWFYSAWFCRSAHRSYVDPSYRNVGLGFRLALSPSGE